MMRLFIFVAAITAYSTIGLVAFSHTTPTKVAKSDTNVTVVNKTSAYPVAGSLFLERCVAQVCAGGINI